MIDDVSEDIGRQLVAQWNHAHTDQVSRQKNQQGLESAVHEQADSSAFGATRSMQPGRNSIPLVAQLLVGDRLILELALRRSTQYPDRGAGTMRLEASIDELCQILWYHVGPKR